MNLDNTGIRLVVKGANVQWPSGQGVGKVVKVSRGSCLIVWRGQRYPKPAYCNAVVVV